MFGRVGSAVQCKLFLSLRKKVILWGNNVSHGDTEHYFEYCFICYSSVTLYFVIYEASSIARLSNMFYCMTSQFLLLRVTAATELAVL
jgi:hypothetical protein